MQLPGRSSVGLVALLWIGSAASFAPNSVAHAQDSSKSVKCIDGVAAATAALCNAYHGGLASSSTEVHGFQYGVETPVDATNQASGKRQHDPITVPKGETGGSPQLLQANATNEVLHTVPGTVTPPAVVPCWNGQLPTLKTPCPARKKKK